MAKEFAYRFYRSSKWLKVRQAYIAKRISIDGGMCEYCGKELGYIVDHVTELTPDNITNPDIALSDDNFKYCCLVCHNKKTFRKYEVVNEGLKFDSDGQLVEINKRDTPPLKTVE